MKKPIFHFEDENYKAFEDYLFTFMPVNKCKDIYIIINCIEDLYDYIQINGIVQKTCSADTPAYTIVRNIMYWYMDWLDDFRDFLYTDCCCYDMLIPEEEVRYEKILKTLKKYTARKNPELDNFFGGNDMKKQTYEDYEKKIEEFDNVKLDTFNSLEFLDGVRKIHFRCSSDKWNFCMNEIAKLPYYKFEAGKKFIVPFEEISPADSGEEIYAVTPWEVMNMFPGSIWYPEELLECKEFMEIIMELESEEKEEPITEPEESTSPEPITEAEDVTRESLLDGAYKCICCDRNKQYGSPEDNFGIIARYWKEYLGVDITAMDVGIMMTLFKIGRMKSGGYKPDNFVDAIGYLACAGECGAKFNIDDGHKCGYGKCTDCWMKEEE